MKHKLPRKLGSEIPPMAYKDVTWTLPARYTDGTGRYRTLQDVTRRYWTIYMRYMAAAMI